MKQSIAKYLSPVMLLSVMTACDNTEQRKATFIQQGHELIAKGEFHQAQMAFQDTLKIDHQNSEARYQLAESLSRQGKVEQAFAEYKTILEQDEQHVMARVRVGQLLLLNGQLQEAARLSAQAQKLSPNNVEVLVFQAGVSSAANDSDAAIVSVEKALRKEPDSVPAALMLASIHGKVGKPEKALRLLEQTVNKHPGNESVRLMLADQLIKSGQLSVAENELNQLVKINSGNLSYYRRLAALYVAQKRYDEAEHTLRAGINTIEYSDELQIALIDLILAKDNIDVAIAELLPLTEQHADSAILQFKLADLYARKGDDANVEITLQNLIKADNKGKTGNKARNVLARFYADKQRHDEAKQLLNDVLAVQSDDAEALLLKGRFALAEQKVDTAIADFRTILMQQPANISALKLLASAHVANNDPGLARENMAKVVALSPQDNAARQDLVDLSLRTGKLNDIETHINAMLTLNPGDLKALQSLYRYSLARKNWEQAQQVAIVIGKKSDNAATGLYLSGMAYQAQGKLEKSIKALEESLKLKPDAIEPLTQLVKGYLALDQAKNAIAYLKKTTKSHNKHFVAFNLLGELYLQKKKYRAAEQAFEQAASVKPEWSTPYKNLARLALVENKSSVAIAVLRKGAEKTGMAMDLVNELASLLHQQGNYNEALQLFEASYKREPQSLLMINNYASYLSHFSKAETALANAAVIARPLEHSSNPGFLDTAAWIAFRQQDYEKARQLLERAVAAGRASPLISYHLGMVYFKQGNNESAKTFLQQALAADIEFQGKNIAAETLKSIKL